MVQCGLGDVPRPARAEGEAGPEVGPLVLDVAERLIRGVAMPPLLTGELKLLCYLGLRPFTWHSSYVISVRVYEREDAAARQLVWKYASLLRKKLAPTLPELIELCRRRGYRCRATLTIVDARDSTAR